MATLTLGRAPRRRARWVVVLLALLAVAYLLLGALRLGPAPWVAIESERPAVGQGTRVVARFAEPARGLGGIRLELVQGEKSVVLAEERFSRASAFSPTRGQFTPKAELAATVGRASQAWLREGDADTRAAGRARERTRRRASPRMNSRWLAEFDTPTTREDGKRSAAQREKLPQPQPRSRMRCPSSMPARAASLSRW